MNELNEVGHFVINMKAFIRENGSLSYSFEFGNENIPLEIVLMHIRAFLGNQEREYFADFDGRIAKFSKSD